MKHPTTVCDVMSRKVITLTEEDTIDKVEDGMSRFRFRHLPVVRGDKVVGLISHRDMLQISSSSLSADRKRRDKLIHQLSAGRIMKQDLITVRPDTTLTAAADLLWEHKIGCLCVTTPDDVLVGIITEADFVRFAESVLRDGSSNADVAPPVS